MKALKVSLIFVDTKVLAIFLRPWECVPPFRCEKPNGEHMPKYIDGFITPVPKSKVKDYKRIAKLAGKVWVEHGALEYVECRGDDVKPGKWTSFPQAVKLKRNEIVFFSWIVYKSKADRNRVIKKVMSDPRLRMDARSMPFDGKRMIWGGFTPFVTM
jgi:uncharacterized protein YbaA (DUF1428 family)